MKKLKVYDQRKFIRSMVLFMVLLAIVIAIPLSGFIGKVVVSTTNNVITTKEHQKTVQEYEMKITEAQKKYEQLEQNKEITLQQKEAEERNYQLQIQKLQQEVAQLKKDRASIEKKYAYVFEEKKHMPNATITLSDLVLLDRRCKQQNVNPHMILAVWKMESGWNTNSKSTVSTARGYGQFLNGTARSTYEKLMKKGKGTYNHSLAFNPKIGTEMSVAYWGYLIESQHGIMKNCFKLYRGEGGEILKHYMNNVNCFMKKYKHGTLETNYTYQ